MLSHNEAQALISASLDTPLDYDIEQVLAEHLAGCEECRLFAASSQRLASALRTMPTVPASPAVRHAVWSAIEQPDPWWSRVGGALSGRTAAMVSTAAIALLVIAFAALVFVRLTGTDDPDDEGARLAAGTEQAIALATETAEPTTTVAPTETTTPPTATAAAPTATTAPTETPPPTDEPTGEAAAPGVPTEKPVDLTGDGATEPTTEPEVTSEVVPALAEIAGTAIPTEEREPTETPVPPTETPAPTETPVPPTQTPEPTATATPEPTETPAPVPALLTVTLVDEDNEPIGDACWVLIENEETVQESCDTPEVETPEFASNGNTGFFDVLPGTYTLRMISAPEGVSVEDREVEIESGRDDTVTITAEVTTPTPAPTETPEPTATPEPTQTPEPTETPVPTETPMPTETPVPTETPEPTQTPEPTPSPTETAASEPTEAPQATATREATSPPIQPVDDQAIEAEGAEATQETAEPAPTDGTGSGPSDEIISPAEATAAVDESPAATETEESTEATIAQIIEPIGGDDQETTPAGAENGDGTQVITGEETPEAASTEETATSESTDDQRAGDGYDLSEAPFFSDGEPWGDVYARLGYEGGVVFTDFPDSVSLDHEFLTVQTDSDGDSTYLTVCAEGCEPATLDSGDDGFTDSPIGWVDNQLIYQRQTGTGETELRALVWDGGVVSDQQIGSMSGTVTPLGRAYPGDNGTLIPTSEVWLLVTGGEATVIDENPFGDIRLARSNFNQPLISYVAGGELIIADRSAPGTPVATLPFSGVDYDISPDLDRVVISTGNSLEIWSLGGDLLGSSGTGTQTGSVLWLSSGIVMIDLSDTAIRLVDPAALVP